VDVAYVSVSSVSADDLTSALSASGTNLFDSAGNPTVYVTQVMPSPFDSSDALIAEYLEELQTHGSRMVPNYVSLEGYVAGRLAIRALQVSAVPLGTSALLSVFDYPLFNLRGLLLGPYSAGTTNDDVCTCNQGLHRVWLTYMAPNASIVQMNDFDFSFDTCNYQFLSPVPPTAVAPGLDAISAAGGIIAAAVVASVVLICIIFAIIIVVLKKNGYLTKKRPPLTRMMTRDQIKGLIPARTTSSGTTLPNSSGGVPVVPTPQPELVDGWQENWMIPESELQLKKKIGSGAYGAVYKASWKGVTVAVKQALAVSVDDQAISAFKREAKIMLSIRPHPNVLTVYGVMISDKVYIVLDYCDLGALSSLFGIGKLSTKRKARVVHDLAAGLSHLHDCNIVHRDVAARNVLLQSGYRCKLSDFGMARAVDKLTKEHTTASTIGPIKWMAPESLRKRKFSFASDVYSFGVTCCEIYAEMPPFMGMELMDAAIAIRDNALTPDIPQDMPKYLRRIVKRCFDPDPALRPTMREILLVIQASIDYLSDSDTSQR
jgi:tRNA A-37 threonylcarbamoyl transferase component Bud32